MAKPSPKKTSSPKKATGTTKNGSKSVSQPVARRTSGRVRSKLMVEDSDEDEVFETPKPIDGVPTLPPTPKTPKRSRKLTNSGSAESDTPLDSPSPTKRLRTLQLDDVSHKPTPFPIIQKANQGMTTPATVEEKMAAANAAVNLEEDEPSKRKKRVKVESESEDSASGEEVEANTGDNSEEEDGDNDGDDPFASKAAAPAPAQTTLEQELMDPRCKKIMKLPKADGIPEYTRDALLYKAVPDLDHPNLTLGAIVTWKKNLSGDNNDTVCYMSMSVYKKITKDKIALANILEGLSMGQDGIFYNPACADPHDFVMKFIDTRFGPQWELVDAAGTPVIGVTVGSCIRSDLRGDSAQDYRTFAIIPHRGHWERMGSFHCMLADVSELVGQVVDNVVSFQTRPKSYRGPAAKEEKPSADLFGGMLEGYQSPTKKATRPLTDRRIHTPYRFDEEVPILDGTGVELDFSSMGLRHLLTTLPTWDDDIPQRAPCVVGYTFTVYEWGKVAKCKMFVQFVIVLAIPK
ncbi:hypothetical protein DFP72DRAFT_1058058 [Ephemerocybe angulata]|uniref:Uncharacterized protein n=1 Tax=Ephemerocybe angulata TaxID=980116 RepID=A0A8H6IID4_9AGAR|nr:hypothetical protein DFP72DRAFT_1058058 [Tulosesus angulatus]